MDSELWLLIGVALLATLSSTVSQIASLKKSDSKLQFFLMSVVIGCLIINLVLTTLLLFGQDDEKKDLRAIQEQRFEATITKLNLTLNKSNSLLDSLRIVKGRISQINDSLQQELITQRKINANTDTIIEKNNDIITSQTRIYQRSDRVVNPLFPLMIHIELEMPMNSPRLKDLKKLVLQSPKKKSTIGFFQDSVIRKSLNTADILDGFDVFFLEDQVSKLSSITSTTRQLNFTIFKEDLFRSLLDVDWEDSTFYITVIYKIPKLRVNSLEPSTVNIGSSDLQHCYLGIRPSPCMIDYKLKYIQLSTTSGLPQVHTMWISNNKKIIDKWSFTEEESEPVRIYIQKIVGKQSSTVPKNRRFTMYNYDK